MNDNNGMNGNRGMGNNRGVTEGDMIRVLNENDCLRYLVDLSMLLTKTRRMSRDDLSLLPTLERMENSFDVMVADFYRVTNNETIN